MMKIRFKDERGNQRELLVESLTSFRYPNAPWHFVSGKTIEDCEASLQMMGYTEIERVEEDE